MTSAALERQTWWSVARAHAAVLVRPGGAWPVLLGCLGAAVLAGVVGHAALPLDDSGAVRLTSGLPVALALAAGAGVHAGWWCEGGAFDGELALVPDRRRLLVGQVLGTALVAGGLGVLGAGVGVLADSLGGSTGVGLPYALLVGLVTAALSAQAVALGVLCRRPVPAALALGALWVVVPVLLASLRTWLDGAAATSVDALVDAGPASLAASSLAGEGVVPALGGLLGELTWAVALGALTWAVLRRRDH